MEKLIYNRITKYIEKNNLLCENQFGFRRHSLTTLAIDSIYDKVCCLFVVTPSFPRDGGTARTAIKVHAVNLIEFRLGERWQPISNQS